jgi:hypothetical protein
VSEQAEARLFSRKALFLPDALNSFAHEPPNSIKIMLQRALALLVLITAGCVNPTMTSIDNGPPIDIFAIGQNMPEKKYGILGSLTDDGALKERDQIEKKMVAQARKKGANLIVFDPPVRSGVEMQGFQAVETYVFHATFGRYQ